MPAFQQAMAQATREFLGDETTAVYGGGGEGGRRVISAYDVNCGLCEEWGERVREIYREATGKDDVDVLDPGNMTGDPDDSLSGHVFLRFEGKFFDAECTEGVANWQQLPLFVKQGDELPPHLRESGPEKANYPNAEPPDPYKDMPFPAEGDRMRQFLRSRKRKRAERPVL